MTDNMDQDLPAQLDVQQPVSSSSFRSRAVPMFSVWLRDLIISLSISAFIIIFLYQPVKVEGTSMMPSLDDRSESSSTNSSTAWNLFSGAISSFSITREILRKASSSASS